MRYSYFVIAKFLSKDIRNCKNILLNVKSVPQG